jgi:membrane-associated phospholipid phosphatase
MLNKIILTIFGILIAYGMQELLAIISYSENGADKLHELFEPLNEIALTNIYFRNTLIIISTLIMDVTIVYMVVYGFVEKSYKTYICLSIMYICRFMCQLIVQLPYPQKLLWTKQMFPSVSATYHIDHDFYFSGHTAISLLFALRIFNTINNSNIKLLQQLRKNKLIIRCIQTFAVLQLIMQIICILILRFHWSQDIITGLFVAYASYKLTNDLCG